MAKTKTAPWDAADFLRDPVAAKTYLSEAFATGDVPYMVKAVGNVLRAGNIGVVARKSGLGRTSLYKAFEGDQHPEFETVVKVLAAMNIQLSAEVRGGDKRRH